MKDVYEIFLIWSTCIIGISVLCVILMFTCALLSTFNIGHQEIAYMLYGFLVGKVFNIIENRKQ